MSRVYNFCPGPATLPLEVLQQVQAELLDWQGLGLSVMEISHRSAPFEAMIDEAEADLRELMAIPPEYKILFLQGGGRSQFAMVPLNLLRGKSTADYIDTGIWSKFALKEAKRYCQVNLVASAAASKYGSIPSRNEWHCNPKAAYFHYVDNETVNGLAFPSIPSSIEAPLVSDMSSSLLSRVFDVSRFALIYAAAQKNIGPAGLTLVIVHEDYLGNALPFTPTMFNYAVHAEKKSLYHTPPTFVWYVIGLMFKWLKRQGGVSAIEEINLRKARKLYDFIDASDFYHNPIEPKYRSNMNVVFRLVDENLNEIFLQKSQQAGLYGLKGHSMVGGMRASLYNAMPEAGVDALVAFMSDFARRC